MRSMIPTPTSRISVPKVLVTFLLEYSHFFARVMQCFRFLRILFGIEDFLLGDCEIYCCYFKFLDTFFRPINRKLL